MQIFIHERAICETASIGSGTRIWAFAHVLSGAKIGKDCNICDGVFIENDVIIGDRVTIKCGVQLWDGLRIDEDVFIGPNATFTNDIFPRSKKYPDKFASIHVCRNASIGANATLLPGIVVGEYAMIGAGAVVTKNVPPNAIVVGNPARIIGYVGSEKSSESNSTSDGNRERCNYRENLSKVRGVSMHTFPEHADIRGDLSVGNFEQQIPFRPSRYFLVYNVPSTETRGAHAHKLCHQFLICVNGSVSVVADDAHSREEFCLNQPNLGLYLPPMTWGIQYKYSLDAVLLVFASHPYSNDDYIRSYEQFVNMRKSA